MDEFIEVTKRPKFKKYFNITDLEEVLSQIGIHAEFIDVRSNIALCRDHKDNFLLSLAIDGQATFLLTGDKDLLEMKSIGKTKIVTATQFLSKKSTKQ